MKKVISFLVIMLVTITLTGCGSKGDTVTCTMNDDNAKSTMTATIKNDKVTKISAEQSETYDDEDELNSAYSLSQFAVSMISGVDGMTAKVDKSGKTLKLTMTMDLTKMSAEDIEDELGSTEFDKDEFIKYAEDEGYTCK